MIWLLAGAMAGAGMMADPYIPGAWRVWLAPTHGHMLFVGWFVQFAVGVAYWLLPRRRSPALPLGYRERPAFIAMAALNLGLLARVAAEPVERSGHAADWTSLTLVGSGALQALALAIVVGQLWPRVAPRPVRRAAEREPAAPPAAERM